jgi:hypothetical protein
MVDIKRGMKKHKYSSSSSRRRPTNHFCLPTFGLLYKRKRKKKYLKALLYTIRQWKQARGRGNNVVIELYVKVTSK